jgi:DMSO/TMAO reductase YedYZ molybdopterin-dependent catalytic subunit
MMLPRQYTSLPRVHPGGPVRSLPPGQHAAELARCGLPRFARREVNPPAQPVLIVTGEVRHPTQFDVRELMARLPRRGQRSDLPCITTWSALDLAWSGTSLRDVIGLIANVVRPYPGAFWLTPPAPGRLLLESSARRRAR